MVEPQDQYEYVNVPSYSGGVPIPQKSDRADLIDKIKPEAIVESVRHKLLGEEQDGNGNWVKNKLLEKYALTERGAWEITNFMLGLSTINTTISKLKEEAIRQRLRRIARTLQLMLIANWREYGIKNVAQLYSTHELVFSNAIVVLFQAGEGSIQELLKGTIQENRMISTEKKEPSKLRRLLGLG